MTTLTFVAICGFAVFVVAVFVDVTTTNWL
jgi:hypothetical protein